MADLQEKLNLDERGANLRSEQSGEEIEEDPFQLCLEDDPPPEEPETLSAPAPAEQKVEQVVPYSNPIQPVSEPPAGEEEDPFQLCLEDDPPPEEPETLSAPAPAEQKVEQVVPYSDSVQPVSEPPAEEEEDPFQLCLEDDPPPEEPETPPAPAPAEPKTGPSAVYREPKDSIQRQQRPVPNRRVSERAVQPEIRKKPEDSERRRTASLSRIRSLIFEEEPAQEEKRPAPMPEPKPEPVQKISLSERSVCSYCGEPVRSSDRFCRNCSSPIHIRRR